jgi:hypothetical protein
MERNEKGEGRREREKGTWEEGRGGDSGGIEGKEAGTEHDSRTMYKEKN